MQRALALFAFSLIAPAIARAADPNPADEAAKQEVVFSVQPKAPPVPTLKYQLLPTLEEMNPGNPVQAYLKCFMERNAWFNDPKIVAERDRWTEMPLARLPVQQILRQYSGNLLGNIDYAARLDTPDWQCLIGLKKEGGMYLLQDVSSVRTLSYTVDVRFRAQVAARHFDDAIASAKTMFAMSRHFGAYPCFVADMMGVRVLTMGVQALEEMVQQRGCPNLYWALSSLPSPMIDIEPGLRGEQQIYSSVPFTSLGSDEPMSGNELQKAIDRLDESAQFFTAVDDGKKWIKGGARRSLESKIADAQNVAAAKQRLIDTGYEAKKLSAFVPLQVILADEYLALKQWQQDEIKVMLLPYWQAEPLLLAQRKNVLQDGDRGSSLRPFFSPVAGGMTSVAELEQRIAMLRCVEALRIYAAEHGDRLPKRLDDLTVPVPLDPVSGNALSYRLDGEIATIQGKPTALMPNYHPNPTFRVVIDRK
jgi:hypothetical protein